MEACNKIWITPLQLEADYSFSRSRQARLRIENKIPYSKVGNYIRYNVEAINQWLEDAKVC